MDKTSSNSCSPHLALNDVGPAATASIAGRFYGRETVACSQCSALEANGAESTGNMLEAVSRADTDVLYFANDLATRQGIIDRLHRNCCTRMICINSPTDLDKHGLMQQVWLRDGQLHKAPGRLFAEEPLMLVFDLTAMHPGEIASINDLLEAEPHCHGKPLGSKVRRVCLVNQQMLDGRQAANPDLWRRLGQMKEGRFSGGAGMTDQQLVQQITTPVEAGKPVVVVDAATIDDWEHHLFGGITLDERGQLLFAPGVLATMADFSHLLIKNMPAERPDALFTVLAGALRAGGFEANRRWFTLSADLTLSFESCRDLAALRAEAVTDCAAFDPQQGFVAINRQVLDSLRGTFRVEGTRVVRTNRLAQLCRGCQQLVITSPLNDQQWLWLCSSLARLPEQVRLFVNLAPDRIVASGWLEAEASKSAEAFIYRISAADSLESLVQQQLLSQNQCTFSSIYSPLMQHLMAGRPVVLEGIEKNPEFAAHLESLLLPNPYLFIHGHKIDLPGGWLRFTKGKNSGSVLFDRILPILPAEGNTQKSPLYDLLRTLPSSHQKSYPNRPPWSASEFACLFDRLTDNERKQDLSLKELPYHRRRAFHEMVKVYRADAEVYGFLKAKAAEHYPDLLIGQQADRSALRQWLSSHPQPDSGLLKSHFWRLARHCPVAVHQDIIWPGGVDQQALDRLAYYLLGVADTPRQLARRLRVDPHRASAQSYYDGTQRASLRDALVAARTELEPGAVISKTLTVLEITVTAMLKRPRNSEVKARQLSEMLGCCFKGHQLPPSCVGLAQALVAGERHIPARQERRLQRLADRIRQHPTIFLQGETGVGKTFMAKAVAGKAGYQDCLAIQLGPDQSREVLFGGQQQVSNNGDHCTQFVPGPLLQWAVNRHNPPLLVLDEANMAPDSVLAPLKGLSCQPAVLDYLGHKYPLTERHRIIYTGNPAHYDGRSVMDCRQTPTFFYHRVAQSTLVATVILPNMPRQWAQTDKQLACERLLGLFNPFSKLVQCRDVRDIKDVLATMTQILGHHQGPPSLTPAQISSLVHRAFIDALGGVLDVEQGKKMATINHWYRSQFPEDRSVLQGVDQAFAAFLTRLQRANGDVDLNSAPMTRLVYRYWQSLDKGNRGRTVTLVSGPPGWGKDLVLDAVVRLWQPGQPLIRVNANPDHWRAVVDAIKRAMTEGLIISISELNVLTSSDLEGVLNSGITGQAAAGFHLFATMNPASFTGREVFSPALKSRCTLFRMALPSQPELVELLLHLPNLPDALPHWLAERFVQWSQALTGQNSPVSLTLDDLFSSARELVRYSCEQWPEVLGRHLSLASRALQKPLGKSELAGKDSCQDSCQEELRRLELERLANAVPGLPSPVWLKWGALVGTELQEGHLKVTRNATAQDVISAVQATLASRPAVGMSQRRISELASFGDITKREPVNVTQHFPPDRYDCNHYRIFFREIALDEHGLLCHYKLTWQDGAVRHLACNRLSPFGTPGKDEVPGNVTLTLHSQWQALPSLSDADQLRALRVQPDISVELARSELTGQLLIRQALREPSLREPTRVVIDFMIIPRQRYFTPLAANERLVCNERLCTPRQQKLLDERVFYPGKKCSCPAFRELRSINGIELVSQRLLALKEWLDTFVAVKNVEGQGESLLLNLLSHKQGVCRHKALIFQVLCHYWGIAARCVSNGASHAFVELSLDGGNSWRLYDAGGEPPQRISDSPVVVPQAMPASAPVDTHQQGGKTAQGTPAEAPPQGAASAQRVSVPVAAGRQDAQSVVCVTNLVELLGLRDRSLKMRIELLLTRMQWQLTDPVATFTQESVLLKKLLLDFINLPPTDARTHYPPPLWELLLTPQFFQQFRHDWGDWHTIIVNSLERMTRQEKPRYFFYTTRYDSLMSMVNSAPESMIDPSYIDWLSELYQCSPNFFKAVLLCLLQKLVKGLDGEALAQVTELAMTYPLKPTTIQLPFWRMSQSGKPLRLTARVIPLSRTLSDKIVQRRVHQQRRYHPGPDSTLVPEKLVAGEPAFVDQTAAVCARTVIIDCTGLAKSALQKKIAPKVRAGIKPEIINALKPEIDYVLAHEKIPVKDGLANYKMKELGAHPLLDPFLTPRKNISPHCAVVKVIENLFFYWLANHYPGTDEDALIWLSREYQYVYKAKLPPNENLLSEDDSDEQKPLLHLPPDRLKAFFHQPSAVVLQSADMLALLDEFLLSVAS